MICNKVKLKKISLNTKKKIEIPSYNFIQIKKKISLNFVNFPKKYGLLTI